MNTLPEKEFGSTSAEIILITGMASGRRTKFLRSLLLSGLKDCLNVSVYTCSDGFDNILGKYKMNKYSFLSIEETEIKNDIHQTLRSDLLENRTILIDDAIYLCDFESDLFKEHSKSKIFISIHSMKQTDLLPTMDHCNTFKLG